MGTAPWFEKNVPHESRCNLELFLQKLLLCTKFRQARGTILQKEPPVPKNVEKDENPRGTNLEKESSVPNASKRGKFR